MLLSQGFAVHVMHAGVHNIHCERIASYRLASLPVDSLRKHPGSSSIDSIRAHSGKSSAPFVESAPAWSSPFAICQYRQRGLRGTLN